MILGRYKISGHSMEPYLNPGDQVVAFKFLKIKKGDVVVFKHHSKIFVKRVKKILNGKYFLEGDNTNDSLTTPPILKSDIMGKVLFKL